MLSSKQRAFLRSMANTMDPIMQVGKGGVGEELITSVDHALEARELIKMSVLDTAPVSAREAADELEEATGADVVALFTYYQDLVSKVSGRDIAQV